MTMKETRFKYTEVGMIPNDWNVIVVGECCNVYTGGECPNEWSKGKDRYFKYPIYSNGKECYGYTFDFRINKDAVCISSIGENTGDVFFYKANFTPIIRLKVIVPKNNGIDTKCLYYFLKYNRIDCTKNGGIPNINSDDVKKIKLSLPPIEEQRRIASALTSIDNLIDSLDRLIAKKRDIKQGAMQQLLSGKKRLKGFTESWVEKKLGDVVTNSIGLTYSPNNVKKYGTLVLRSSNIKNGKLIFEDNVFVEMSIPERAKVHTNDLLVCVRNGSKALIGKSAVITEDAEGMAFGAFMTILRANGIEQIFLNYYWQTDFIQKQVRDNMGATINQITNADISDFDIYVPSSLPEQQAIASILTSMDNELSALEAKRKKYEQIKRGMMQQLLTGKIRLAQ